MTTKYGQSDEQARVFFISKAMRDQWAGGPIAGRRVWVPSAAGVKEDGRNSVVITAPLFTQTPRLLIRLS
eukprot:595178-Pyramimonas_sp.AAC.1